MFLPTLSRRERALLFTFALLALVALFGPGVPRPTSAIWPRIPATRARHGPARWRSTA